MASTVERTAVPPGAVLVRVFAHGLSWVRTLPAVPGGTPVTVTVSHPRLRDVPADDLVAQGYRIVGVAARRPEGTGEVVDVLVPPELRAAHPDWWSELVAGADRAFACDLGPVRRLLGPVLDVHAAALAGDPPSAPTSR